MTSLCDVWWCSNTISGMPSTFPKVKKSYSWETSFVSKKKLFISSSTLLWLNRRKKVLRWNHQANELQLFPSLKPVKALSQMTPTWKEMRSFTHFQGYSSLKCSKQTFTVRSAIVNSFTSSVFPSETSEANGETEKNSLSSVEDFTPF